METLTSFLAILAGVFLRLVIPIIGTSFLIFFLRRLDARWQAEAKFQPLSVEKTECWKIKDCRPEQQQTCTARSSTLPCWQVYRLANGYLREECISCEVFIDAPVPTLQVEPRRL